MPTNADLARVSQSMGHEHVVAALVKRARNGDKRAWDALVERYAPLIWSICRRYRLDGPDAGDVGQSVWLQLVDQLGRIRDPAALPGWVATTTRQECVRVLRAARALDTARHQADAESIPDELVVTAGQEMLMAEHHAALREALTRLPACCQRLIALLIKDPPVPYAEISARLAIPVDRIEPGRGRCLARLRRDPAIATLTNAGPGAAEKMPGPEVVQPSPGLRPLG